MVARHIQKDASDDYPPFLSGTRHRMGEPLPIGWRRKGSDAEMDF